MRRLLRGIGNGLMLLFLALFGTLVLLFMWPVETVRKWWWQLRHRRPRQPQP